MNADKIATWTDRGAQWLRERQMSGRITLPWGRVSKPAKSKWVTSAAGVLRASGVLDELDRHQRFLDAYDERGRLLAEAVEELARTTYSAEAVCGQLNPQLLPAGLAQQLEATHEQLRRARALLSKLKEATDGTR